jgi:hypothetical protein
VVEFVFEYLPATVAFVMHLDGKLTPTEEILRGICENQTDVQFTSTMTGKLQVCKEELTRIAEFYDRSQKRMTTFGLILSAVVALQHDLRVSPSPDPDAPRPQCAVVDWRRMPQSYVTELMESVKEFRRTVADAFQSSLTKHFYRDDMILPLAEGAQVLVPKSPMRTSATWATVARAVRWWCEMTGAEEGIEDTIRAQFELYKHMSFDLPVDHAVPFWYQRTDGCLADLARFALDVLCLPIGSAEVERSFSEQRKTDTKQSTSSSPALAELKACLYQNRHIEQDSQFADVRSDVFDLWVDSVFDGRFPRPSRARQLSEAIVQSDPALFDAETNGNPVEAESEADDEEPGLQPFVWLGEDDDE